MIVFEIIWCILHYIMTTNQAENVYCQLAVDHNVNQNDASCRGQGITYSRNQANINDHQSSKVTNFIIEIRSLNEGKKCKHCYKYKRNEYSQRIYYRILIEWYSKSDVFERLIISFDILLVIVDKIFVTIDIQFSLGKIILSQRTIICKSKLLEDVFSLLKRLISYSLHAVKFKLYVFIIAQCHVYILKAENQFEFQKVERCDQILPDCTRRQSYFELFSDCPSNVLDRLFWF